MKKILPVVLGFVGLIIGFLLRPEFVDSMAYKGSAPDKPSLMMMVQCGITGCNHPDITSASRYGLVYMILGLIVGVALGVLFGSLLAKKAEG